MLVLDLCWYCCSQYQETYQTCQYLVVSLHGALGIFCKRCDEVEVESSSASTQFLLLPSAVMHLHQGQKCIADKYWSICFKSQTFLTERSDDWYYGMLDFDRRHLDWLVLLFGQIRLPSLFLPNMGLLIYSFGLASFLAERLICIVASVSIITWIWSGSKKKTHY